MRVQLGALELINAVKPGHVRVHVVACAYHHPVELLHGDGLRLRVLRAPGTHLPAAGLLMVLRGSDALHAAAEPHMLQQLELLGVHSHVGHDAGVWHEGWERLGHGEVAEGRHLFGRVDDAASVDATLAWLGLLRVVPQTPHVALSLEAGHTEPLLKAGLDGSKTAAAGADDSNVLGHAGLLFWFLSSVEV